MVAAAARWLQRTPRDVIVCKSSQEFEVALSLYYLLAGKQHHCVESVQGTLGKQLDMMLEEIRHPG